MKRILTLIRKELLVSLQDTRTRVSLLAPPLIQLFIFTFAATLDVSNVSMGIYNRDAGEKSFELIQRFKGSPTFQKIVYLENIEQVKGFLDAQKGVMVMMFDEQFSRDLEGGKSANLELLFDGRKSNSAQIILGYSLSIINQFSYELNPKIGKIDAVDRSWFNPNLLYYWFNIPSLVATLSMLICIIVTSNSISREKELGTYDQLLISPLSPFEILMGKTLPGIIIGMIEGCSLALVGVYLLQVPFTGSVTLFLISLLIFVFSVSGLGIFISTISSTQQQAMLGAFILLVPSILLSGFATPIENMPAWLQPMAYLIPLQYMLVLAKGLFLKAMPLTVAMKNLWPLLLIGGCNLVGAGLFFKRRLLS